MSSTSAETAPARAHVMPPFTGITAAAGIVIVIGTIVGGLGHAFPDVAGPARLLAAAGYVTFILAELRRLSPGVWAYLAVGVAITLGAYQTHPDPVPHLVEGFSRSAFLGTLFIALGALGYVARTSPMIHRCGQVLIRQPPGRRYIALTLGAHVFGLLLNFGSIALLGVMAKEANTLDAAGGEERIMRIRERRMMMAILRGFSTVMVWSPFSMAAGVILTVMKGVDWIDLFPLGLAGGACLLFIGWLVDRLFEPRPTQPPVDDPISRDWGAFIPLTGLIAMVFLGALGAEYVTGAAMIYGAFLFAPIIAAIWLVRQAGSGMAKIAAFLTEQVPSQRSEMAIAGMSAAAGTFIAGFIPPETIAAIITASGLPPAGILASMVLAIIVIGVVGINPMVPVIILGTALADPMAFGFTPVVLALTLVAGWCIAVSASPVTGATLVVARLTGQPPTVIGRRWNLAYSLIAGTVVVAAVVVLQTLLPNA